MSRIAQHRITQGISNLKMHRIEHEGHYHYFFTYTNPDGRQRMRSVGFVSSSNNYDAKTSLDLLMNQVSEERLINSLPRVYRDGQEYREENYMMDIFIDQMRDSLKIKISPHDMFQADLNQHYNIGEAGVIQRICVNQVKRNLEVGNIFSERNFNDASNFDEGLQSILVRAGLSEDLARIVGEGVADLQISLARKTQELQTAEVTIANQARIIEQNRRVENVAHQNPEFDEDDIDNKSICSNETPTRDHLVINDAEPAASRGRRVTLI